MVAAAGADRSRTRHQAGGGRGQALAATTTARSSQWWENEAPTTRAARRPVPGNAPGGTSAPSSNLCLSMSGRLPQTGQPTPAWGATALDEPDKVMRARERAAQAKARELAVHRRAEELHEQAAETQERLGHPDFAQA